MTTATLDDVIRRLIIELRIPDEHRLWSAGDIAQYLGLAKRTVAERLVFTPGFPRPVDVGPRRWYMAEVIEWARGRQERKGGRSSDGYGGA